MKLLEGFVILQQNPGYSPISLYMKENERVPYPDAEAADTAARSLAAANPGIRYYTAELTSASISERPVSTITLRKHRGE